ncbi:hypothetical protein [Sporosarcina sp. FA15]|uniref:hypothetical protein n=1 Tax=Sporosarcina sp. FA15 TaxID=3413031 RepID=UPI003F660948
MKKTMLLMLTVIIIAGCNGISSNNTYKQAEGKVIVGTHDYIMMIGEFEWLDTDVKFRKIGSSDINDLAVGFNTLQVEKGGKLKIEIEENPSSIILKQWNEDETSDVVELKDNEIILPSEEGYYIYEVIVEWNKGKATYVFDINIK